MKTTTLLITTIIAVIALSVTGCPSPVGGGTEQPGPQPEPEHEHKYTVKISEKKYYENIRWKDKLGKELEEGEEGYWVTAAYPTETEPHYVIRRGSGIEVVETVWGCEARDGATHTEYVRGDERKHFESDRRALTANEELVDGEIIKGNTNEEEDISLPSDKTSALITSPDAIDVVQIIQNNNGALGEIKNDFDARMTVGAALEPLSVQAARLQEFFAGCTGSVDIAGFPSFAKLQENQNAIRTGILGSTTVTPTGYLELVAGKDDVMDKLFASGDAKVLWDGYKAGHYAITRDWRLAGIEADCADEVSAFTAAAEAADHPVIGYPGEYSDGRGFAIPGVGSDPENILAWIEVDLVDKGAQLLIDNGGVPESERETAKAMVRALVVQFGQDTEQFRALVNDLQTNSGEFIDALGASYHKYNLQPEPVSSDAEVSMAPIGQQSVKLAAVNRKRKSA